MTQKSTAKGGLEKRGGYPSSAKSASELKPPPRGPAPGGRRPPNASNGQQGSGDKSS
jgi:hypothetical protein